jgi:hypothetical protein
VHWCSHINTNTWWLDSGYNTFIHHENRKHAVVIGPISEVRDAKQCLNHYATALSDNGQMNIFLASKLGEQYPRTTYKKPRSEIVQLLKGEGNKITGTNSKL